MVSKSPGGRSIHLRYGVLECPLGIWEVIGSNPLGHSDFFVIFTFVLLSLKFTSFHSFTNTKSVKR